MQQLGAGELLAGRTELMATGGKFLAVLYGAGKACVRLVAVTSSTAWAGFAISTIRPAQAAVQATWRDDPRIACLNLHKSVRHAAPSTSAASADR